MYSEGEAQALHLFTIFPFEGLNIDRLESIVRKKGLECFIEKLDKRLYRIEIIIRTRYEQGYLILDGDYWLFVSNGDMIRQVAESFLKNMFPVIKPIYLDSEELFSVVDRLEETYDKTMFLDGTLVSQWKTLRNWQREPIEYSRGSLEEEEKKQEARWISLKLSNYIGNALKLKCRIYNNGHLTLYSGEFTKFYDIALDIARIGSKKDKLFSNRQRKIAEGKILLNPLKFELADHLGMADLGKIKGELIKNYSATIIHSGNPILLVQITDKQDGSSFDFYSYGKKIEIVPLSKASSAAVTKIYGLISGILPTAKFMG
jgi:hypothetical protein